MIKKLLRAHETKKFKLYIHYSASSISKGFTKRGLESRSTSASAPLTFTCVSAL